MKNYIIFKNEFQQMQTLDKVICFGVVCLWFVCVVGLCFSVVVGVGEVLTASIPLVFYIDTELKNSGNQRASKIKQNKALLNDFCGLWFTGVAICGGSIIKDSRRNSNNLYSYYGGQDETTLQVITITQPPKDTESINALLEGIKSIWQDGVLFCQIGGKILTLKSVINASKKIK